MGSDFVPASAGTPGQAGQAGQPAAAAQQQGIDAKEGLAALAQLGEQYSEPIITADGSVYLETRQPELVGGKLALHYVLAGKIDKSTQRMLLNPTFVEQIKAKRDPSAKLIKDGENFFWQTMVKGENGQLTAKLEPASAAEVQAESQKAQSQQGQQQLQEWNQDKVEWIRKLSTMSSLMKIVGYSGSFVQTLSMGPNPMTGKPYANWLTGYQVVQMLDAQAQGKLLPQWMKSGPVGTALEWAMQGYYMLDIGSDLRTLGAAFPRAAAAMNVFTSPTRAVLGGITGAIKGAAAATQPAAGASQAVAGALTQAGPRVGMAGEALNRAQAAAQAAAGAGQSAAMTDALKGLGMGLGKGQLAIVGAPGTNLAGNVAIMNAQGALQMVPKSAIYDATKLVSPPLSAGAQIQSNINAGVHGALGALGPMLRTLQVGGSILGAVAGGINLAVTVKNQGAKSLITTRDGRGTLFGFLGSATFLGMLALPLAAPALGPGIAVASAGLSVLSNVFSGVSMLNYAGLFGEGGFLDHDAVRAAFLIPPLTPLGLAALQMKKREKDAKAKQTQLEANQKVAMQNIAKLRAQSAEQLQQAGAVAGATTGKDGSIIVPTGVSNDLSEVGPAPGSTAPQLGADTSRSLQLAARRMG